VPVSQKETYQYLEALFKNRFAEAERILQQMLEKHPDDARYIQALRGLYQSYTGEDRDSLIYNIYLNEEIKKMQPEIKTYMEKLSTLLGAEDRYFIAWKDILTLLDKLDKPLKMASEKEH